MPGSLSQWLAKYSQALGPIRKVAHEQAGYSQAAKHQAAENEQIIPMTATLLTAWSAQISKTFLCG